MITFNENELSFNNNGTMTPIPYFANATASSLDARLDAVETELPTKMDKWDLLWTNASPTSEFPVQTVSLALSNYIFIAIECQFSTASPNNNSICFVRKNSTGGLIYAFNQGANPIQFCTRRGSVSNTGVAFTGGFLTSTQDNSYAIPINIYGIK